MTSALIPSRELQILVESLAEGLSRSVVVNDPSVRLICASRHFGDEDPVRIRAMLQRDAGADVGRFVLAQGAATWHEPHFVCGDAELGLKDRYCVPLYGQGWLVGLLMVIDADHSLTEQERAQIGRSSRDIAAQMYSDSLVTDVDQLQRQDAVLKLLGDDGAAREAASSFLDERRVLSDAGYVAVTSVNLDDAETDVPVDTALRIGIDAATRPHDRATEIGIGGNRGFVVCIASQPIARDQLRLQASRITSEMQRVAGSAIKAAVGIGLVDTGRSDAWLARHRADVAALAVTRLPQLGGEVAFWDELGADAILLQIPSSAPDTTTIPASIQALLRFDRDGKLTETLTSYLDHGGSIVATAKALHLHRTSLYYRLEQIESATGKSLADGRDRLELHVGLRLSAMRRTVR